MAAANSLYAARIHGIISTASGQPIPYTSVYVENSTVGVLSNLRGEYILELPAGDYRLVFQNVGYERHTERVLLRNDTTLNIRLTAITIAVDTVRISAGKEDPAYEIMRKAIARKGDYITPCNTFTRETYFKAVLEADTTARRHKKVAAKDSTATDSIRQTKTAAAPAKSGGFSLSFGGKKEKTPEKSPIKTDSTAGDSTAMAAKKDSTSKPELVRTQFVESQMTEYFAAPNDFKSVVHGLRNFAAEKSGGSFSVSFGDNGTGGGSVLNPYIFVPDNGNTPFNFYENTFFVRAISDQPFVSPLNSLMWRASYRYKLVDKLYEDGTVVYKIHVEPRSSAGAYFEGDMYIVDDSWVIKSVNFSVLRSALSLHKEFHFIHRYEQQASGTWLLAHEDYYYQTKDGRDQLYGNSLAMHSNYKINVQHPKNFFKNEVRHIEDEANDKDSTYWNKIRPVSLKATEKTYIKAQDSIRVYQKSPAYFAKIDSEYNQFKWENIFLNGYQYRQRSGEVIRTYYINPLINQVRPFGVGGIRYAPGGSYTHRFRRGYALDFDGEFNYGFANKDIRGEIGAGYMFLPKKFARFNVKYSNNYAMINNAATLISLLGRGNFVNKIGYEASYRMELVNGLFGRAHVELLDYRSISNMKMDSWSGRVFGDYNVPQDFQPFRQCLLDISFTYTPAQKYEMRPYSKVILGSKYPTFEAKFHAAVPGVAGSTLNFSYLELSAKQALHLPLLGDAQWVVYAGKFLNTKNIRFIDYKFIRGSDPILFAPPMMFMQLLDKTRTTTNEYLQAHYLQEFGRGVIDRIPLVNKLPIQLTGGGSLLLLRDNAFVHAELYGGLLVPFRIRSQRMRVGAYYVTAYSNNLQRVDGQFKVGISFYDPIKRRWNYGE